MPGDLTRGLMNCIYFPHVMNVGTQIWRVKKLISWASDLAVKSRSILSLGEGNGNPLQCSCLENPRDRGAWWAAVYRVAQSQTWLKWLSSSGKASLVSPSITESISQGHCPAQEKRTRENSMPQGQPVLPSKDWPSSVNCWKELHGQSWGRNSALFIFHPVRIKTRTQST